MMLNNKQRIWLSSSKEFQRIVDADPVLKMINDSKEDKGAEIFSLMEMFRAVVRIGHVDIQPITPAIWAFLWAIDNSYTKDFKDITPEDTDIFFWILRNGVRKLECELAEIPVRCAGAIEKEGLDYDDVAAELMQLIHYTFRPMAFFPASTEVSGKQSFDSWWLTKICAIAAAESGEKARDVMFNMPLSTCLYYFVHYSAKNDTRKIIYRRTPQEINRQIIERLDQLGEEFCLRHNIDIER